MAENNAQAVIDVVRELEGVEVISVERGSIAKAAILSIPEGRTLESVKKYLDDYLDFPERRMGTSQHTTLDSFIASTDRFKDAHSAIYLDDLNRAQPVLVAVFDYHEPIADDGHARYGVHRAQYAFPVSDEWKAWTGAVGKQMSQTDFATFLEDRIAEVLTPDAAGASVRDFAQTVGITLATPQRLVELSKGLQVSVDRKVANAVNLSTGEAQFNFVETHNDRDGAPLKVPNGFAIGIPVFRNGVRYPIPVRLRYRVKEGAVLWSIALSNLDKYFEDAISEAATIVAEKTLLTVFRGRPE